MRGMDAGEAARTYTILTIGEGLVAQIPALIISTAAGIIVTRVASEEEGGNLGRDIGGQILGQPKALIDRRGACWCCWRSCRACPWSRSSSWRSCCPGWAGG